MMSALKCSIPTPCPAATFVKHWLVSAFLRLFIKVPKTAWITNEVRSARTVRDDIEDANSGKNALFRALSQRTCLPT